MVSPPPSLLGDVCSVGQIVVDKKAGQFTVPGTILRRDPPLEFLAVVQPALAFNLVVLLVIAIMAGRVVPSFTNEAGK